MSVSATTNGIRPGVCLSTAKPSNPFIGQVIYMSDTDETAVWDGTYWEGLNRSRDRNIIINGAMQIHQRGASTANITTSGYYTADRWKSDFQTLGTWTQSVENDAPTGTGFRKSLKVLCTTADASPAAADFFVIRQLFEGQNIQQFAKGTASAKQFSLSFWVKSNLTGTYSINLEDVDNGRIIAASYTIASSGAWEKKIINFPADTVGLFENDNGASLLLNIWLAGGSNYTGGTLQTAWGSPNFTNGSVASGQANLAASTNNYWQITGVQLEAGSVATPFEFEDYSTTLVKCQRYYEKSYAIETAPGTATSTNLIMCMPGHAGASTAGAMDGYIFFKVTKRAGATVTIYDANGNAGKCRRTAIGVANYDNQATQDISVDSCGFYFRSASGNSSNTMTAHFVASAEL